MDAETSDVTDDMETSEEFAEEWANVLVKLDANVAQTEEYHTSMEEMATCESNSHARPC